MEKAFESQAEKEKAPKPPVSREEYFERKQKLWSLHGTVPDDRKEMELIMSRGGEEAERIRQTLDEMEAEQAALDAYEKANPQETK